MGVRFTCLDDSVHPISYYGIHPLPVSPIHTAVSKIAAGTQKAHRFSFFSDIGDGGYVMGCRGVDIPGKVPAPEYACVQGKFDATIVQFA